MPPPSRLYALWLAITGELFRHIFATTWRVLFGFALGVIAGTLVGALAGASRLSKDLLDPTLQGLRSVPSIAWIPVFILWLGIFEQSKLALIAAGCFFPVYLGVLGAILSVDRKVVEVGRIFRLSDVALVRILRGVSRYVVVSARAWGSAGCSWSRPNSWAPRRVSAIC
jgi:sulfonate transport system permease protein